MKEAKHKGFQKSTECPTEMEGSKSPSTAGQAINRKQGNRNMSLVPTPATIADSPPPRARPLLEAVNKEPGVVVNTLRLVSIIPQALEVYLALSGALGGGTFPAATPERIAPAAAGIDGREYDLSVRAYLDKNLAHLNGAATAARRTARRMIRRRVRRYIPPAR